jgi:DNA-binding LacI/PurR family transcriptional regulator
MEEEGLPVPEAFIIEGDFRFEGGQLAAQELLTLNQPPTAILACNDMMAIGALDAARRLGIHVPDDVSLVGFDDIFLASLVDPPLTTVAQAAYQLGDLAVDQLLRRVEGLEPAETREICLPTKLVIRKSTAARSQ